MVIDVFRAWSPTPEVELAGVLPLVIVGMPAAGIAGWMALPFTAGLASCLPFCELLAAADGVELPDAEEGEIVFFVALA